MFSIINFVYALLHIIIKQNSHTKPLALPLVTNAVHSVFFMHLFVLILVM